MEVVAALLQVLALARTVEGGVEAFVPLVAALHAGGKLTDDQLEKVRVDGAVEDVLTDQAIADAKARLSGGNAPPPMTT